MERRSRKETKRTSEAREASDSLALFGGCGRLGTRLSVRCELQDLHVPADAGATGHIARESEAGIGVTGRDSSTQVLTSVSASCGS